MWAHLINALLGTWMMAAPAVLGYGDPARTNDRIVGPVAATCAIIAWWEVMRGVGRVNLLFGLWLVAAPWVLGYDATAALVNSTAVGVAMAALSFVRGRITKRYGGGWAALLRPDGLHHREARRVGEEYSKS